MKIKNVFEPLFSFGTDYLSNACINSYNEPITLYSAGYKEAARRLTERALNESGSIDILVFPIIFLYRHYLELKLKEIILNGTDLLYSNPIITTGHSFSNLWNLANPLIEEVYKDEKDKEPLQLLKHVINEFIKIDQNSIAFRYPLTVDKKTKPTRYRAHKYQALFRVHGKSFRIIGWNKRGYI